MREEQGHCAHTHCAYGDGHRRRRVLHPEIPGNFTMWVSTTKFLLTNPVTDVLDSRAKPGSVPSGLPAHPRRRRGFMASIAFCGHIRAGWGFLNYVV